MGPQNAGEMPDPTKHESAVRRWSRRAVTFTAYWLAWAALLVGLPVWLVVTVVADLVAKRRFVFTRCLLMGLVYLSAEVAGMLASGWIWLTGGGWRREPGEEYLRRNFRLQCWWAEMQFRAAVRIFGLDVEVTGDREAARGPVLVFIRHVSPVDNLIPAVFLAAWHGTRLRWLINRSLLRDPCLDLVGNRLPNAFVRGSSAEGERYVAMVGAVAKGLGDRDGVLIYPEGGLFSGARRERVLARLQESDPEAYERGAALQNVLVPRMGGALALLRAAPDADVVFCAHTGLEIAGSYRAMLSGDVIGRRVRIEFRRVPRGEIPGDEVAQAAWLWDEWSKVDRAITAGLGRVEGAET